ncbi:MAG TPA: cupin domain-containing protein [Candidatus Bathyarchaeia archaeon]|nr:cupin domain-containing protein [Candidatus Bathyarchaeia archaeon]
MKSKTFLVRVFANRIGSPFSSRYASEQAEPTASTGYFFASDVTSTVADMASAADTPAHPTMTVYSPQEKNTGAAVRHSVLQQHTRNPPHLQDEIYFIVRGQGVLFHDGKRDRFESGDLLFVAAGIEHQIEESSENFVMWRVFYGRHGGEASA